MEKTGKSGVAVAQEIFNRRDNGWTSRALSHGIGVVENLDKIAAVTGVSAAYLFCGVDTARFVTVDQVQAMIREATRGDAHAHLDVAEDAVTASDD